MAQVDFVVSAVRPVVASSPLRNTSRQRRVQDGASQANQICASRKRMGKQRGQDEKGVCQWSSLSSSWTLSRASSAFSLLHTRAASSTAIPQHLARRQPETTTHPGQVHPAEHLALPPHTTNALLLPPKMVLPLPHPHRRRLSSSPLPSSLIHRSNPSLLAFLSTTSRRHSTFAHDPANLLSYRSHLELTTSPRAQITHSPTLGFDRISS